MLKELRKIVGSDICIAIAGNKIDLEKDTVFSSPTMLCLLMIMSISYRCVNVYLTL